MMKKSASKQVVCGVAIVAALLVSVVSLFAFSLGKYEKAPVSGDEVRVAMNRVAGGKARFYKYTANGKEIAFFVVKAADGSYKTAFDACDACFASKKGYEQQGDKMNCRNCNQKFAIGRLGPNATGGCNPGYLPSQVREGNIVIKLADIKSGARYF